jgi:hypothetical protein
MAIVILDGVMIVVLAIEPTFAGSNQAEGDGG